MPILPAAQFSNRDLWLDNLIVRDRQLVGVIDFENAGFSDPFYEILLPFIVSSELRGRGIEQRYCQCMGFDDGVLYWYHGLNTLIPGVGSGQQEIPSINTIDRIYRRRGRIGSLRLESRSSSIGAPANYILNQSHPLAC